jgi:TorA maturation chaperone TorD
MTFDPDDACDVISEADSSFPRKAFSTCREVSATRTTGTSAVQGAEARADMYRFFSAVYLSPINEDLLRRLVDEEFLDELSTLFGGPAVAELRDFAASVSVENDLPSLRQEYMDLFAVPMGRYVTPFEDVFRGRSADGKEVRGPLLGERAIAVTRVYRGAGAEMDGACKELPTHVGVELSFMNFLCRRESASHRAQVPGATPDREKETLSEPTTYRELQSRFLREHLNRWFPQLSFTIQASAGGPLYRGLAVLTEEFLVRDAAVLLTQIQDQRAPESSGAG